ncbi:dihydroxyacetone kinase subunit DhaL [Streptomyces sp. TRM 70351]|uniref:dihydroxyacetone kinase subunit DhaL n=1 Tax=Streptomyces sp. TRM 70351 TaxID=3116552 RepID=UPI002E7C2C99|nr:dihydroxyacetone kinase subunit DhaL [Streptomyces sp. TRM 70351]MEE1930214.1 dihydroxyacetone kinase subunit DhaL [Streptomyces sp. TRM 70351]
MIYDVSYTDGWVRRFAESVHGTEPELTALDQRTGDGDFGVNLAAGVTSAVRALDGAAGAAGTDDASAPLHVLATVFLDEVGGTSGPLFGLLFQELAAAVRAAGPHLTTPALAAGAGAGLAAIRRVGEAAPGDKTLVDALVPAAEALEQCADGVKPDKALAAAAEGAWSGVRGTAELRARRGRASYLGERASGVPDPGAVGVGLLFASAERPVTALAPLLP